MSGPAQFRSVLRGYDPDQVTAAISELTTSLSIARRTAAERTLELATAQEREAALAQELQDAVARLAATEHAGHDTAPGDLGTRVAAILALAEEEAGQRRVEAERDAEDIRLAAEAEATRMKAAAVSSADAVLEQASQELAAQREATAAAQARLVEAERTAAQIVASGREEAERERRRIRAEFEHEARARDEIRRQLVAVSAMLDQLDTELTLEVDDRAGPASGRSDGPAAPVEA
jgi:hypothetical protein